MVDACQVDFYVLQNERQSEGQVACWLALKAWSAGQRVAVRTSGETEARTLDELMWDFPEQRFLPHERGADSSAPIAIGTVSDHFGSDRKVLINLDASPVTDTGELDRILEIVPANETHRLASREKFRHYRKLGIDPDHHQLNPQ